MRVDAGNGPALFVIAPKSGVSRVRIESTAEDASSLAAGDSITMSVRGLGGRRFSGAVLNRASRRGDEGAAVAAVGVGSRRPGLAGRRAV